jgi:hypothetical protein
MVQQALHEHGTTQAAQDDRLTGSATSSKAKVRKILDTTYVMSKLNSRSVSAMLVK